MQEEKAVENLLIEKRKEKLFSFIKEKKQWIVYLVLAFILYINVRIRTSNMPLLKDITTGGWTLGPDLDPFLFLRWAKYIVANGSLIAVDMMKSVPLGYETANEMRFIPYGIAYLYKFLKVFSQNVTVDYAAVIFPVILSVFMVIAFFLFIRKAFSLYFREKPVIANIIALIATAFLVVSPSLLSRTIAGIPEKESAGFFFMFLTFYFFLAAWDAEKLKKSLIFASLAGISTALMGHAWGGIIYIFTTVAISVFIAFIFGKTSEKHFFLYTCWIFFFMILLLPFTKRFTLMSLLSSTSSGLVFACFLFMLVDLIIFRTKISQNSFLKKTEEKIPRQIISLVVSVGIVLIFSTIIFGFNFVPGFIGDLIEHLTTPYTDRLSFTVAENRQPYFVDEWKGSFGPIIQQIPLFFWLFLIGSIFLFYETVRKIKIRERVILILGYVIFIFSLIFSRYSPSSSFNGTNFLSKLLYFGGMVIFAASFIYVYLRYYKEKEFELLKEINFSYIFVFIFFFICIVGARSAVRLIMVLAPPAAIIVSFFVISVTLKAQASKKEEIFKILIWAVAIVIIFATFYTLFVYYQATRDNAKNFGPSYYTKQWQEAMAWVRNNTDKNAVFSHWWDYGYWIQSMGERATVLDGGNTMGYWNHLIGRYVLTGTTEKPALEFLYAHNVTHLLIDSTEIGKYGAYSNIGSDENYDRYSWIPTILLNEKSTQETKNSTIYVYQAGFVLDEDILWKDNEGKEIFLPAGKAGLGAVLLETENESLDEIKKAEGIFVYQSKQYNIPLKYVYYNKLYQFENGTEAGIFIMPRITYKEQGISINPIGAAFYLSKRTVNSHLARLYLFGEERDGFKIVHTQSNLIIEQLRKQGLTIGEFALLNDFLGPIKIWQVNYPSDISLKKEYLLTAYPEEKLWKVK